MGYSPICPHYHVLSVLSCDIDHNLSGTAQRSDMRNITQSMPYSITVMSMSLNAISVSIYLLIIAARKILEEALLKGYVLLTIIKCLILGAAGSGKTHVKHALLNEEPPEDRISTALAEPIRAVSRVIAGTVKAVTGWFRITHDELMKLLAQALKAGVAMETKDETVHEHDSDDTVRHSSPLQDRQHSSIHSPSSSNKHQHTRINSPTFKPEVSPSQEQLVRLVEQSAGSKRFLELQWIHFIDSGGQPQFHEVLPAFIRNTSSTMVVVKLSESLDHCPTMEYYDRKGERCGEPCPYFLRNDQILQHCIQTVKSQPSFQGKGGYLKILVVGTHQDHEDESPETRDQKNQKLQQMLMPSLRKELVFYRLSSPKEVIFPMNVKKPGEQDHDVAAMLREAIADEKTAPPPYKVPIGWFLLEEDIRQLGGGVVSKEECLHIASRLKITKKGLDAALVYLDELNIFLYYPSLLPQVVFSDPQVLLDKITELVSFSYSLRSGSAPPGAFGNEWSRFPDEGIVTVEMLLDKRFSSHYIPGLFEPSDLIKLFEKLLILSPLSSSEFFMPSLLAMISPCETKKYQVSLSTPLLVHYPSGCAQHGIFCGLVVYLHSSCRWNISYQADDTPVCVSRNCIVFQLPGRPVTVTLIDSFSYLEVHITAPDCMYTKFCPEVRKSIFLGLEKAAQAFHYNESEPQVAFFCNCSSPSHAATPYIHGQDRYLVCTKTSNYTTLENKHSIWLEESGKQAGIELQSIMHCYCSTCTSNNILHVINIVFFVGNKGKLTSSAAGLGPEAKTAKLSPSVGRYNRNTKFN